MREGRECSWKVQFISINNVWRYINLGIDQLAGYLRREGFDVRLSYSLRRYSAEQIFADLDLTCQVFAFSVMTANYERSKEVIELIKEAKPNAIIVFGGGFVTRYYNEVLDEFPAVDYITLGDGELPTAYLFGELRAAWVDGRIPNVSHPSVVTHGSRVGKVVQINRDVVDMPALDGYEEFFAEHNKRKVHCIQSKNNICTGKCSFCTERHGHPVFRDVNVLVHQIVTVHKKYGVTKFFLRTTTFLIPTMRRRESMSIGCVMHFGRRGSSWRINVILRPCRFMIRRQIMPCWRICGLQVSSKSFLVLKREIKKILICTER